MPRRFPAVITREHLAQSGRTESGQLAWLYPTILEVIEALAAHGYAILGGDVMRLDKKQGTLGYYHGEMYCGNWSIDWKRWESWVEYVAASLDVTRRYVEAYVMRNGDTYWFVPSFTDEAGWWALPGRRA